MPEYVLLWLEAPLQSWGFDSKYDRRDTGAFPTKSGVLGLLFSSMGLGGEQEDALAVWADRDLVVESFDRIDGKGVRQEPPERLRDFQTVGTHFDDRDPWESLMIPKTREGKKAVGGGSKITHRYYLQDAAFAVAAELPPGWRERVSQGLQAPVWGIFLGRKNCAPTDFVFRGVFDTAESALEAGRAIASEKKRTPSFRVLHGSRAGEGDVRTVNDVPLCFGPYKRYRDRRVTVVRSN